MAMSTLLGSSSSFSSSSRSAVCRRMRIILEEIAEFDRWPVELFTIIAEYIVTTRLFTR
jgi:hypothetical protein